MPPTSLVQGWIDLAEQDYKVAEHLLGDSDVLFYRSIGFHAQQAAEKYLKGLLVTRAVTFPKTHDLGRLLQLLAEHGGLPTGLQLDTGSLLDRYGVGVRYPDDLDPVSEVEAREAFAVATHIRTVIRPLLLAKERKSSS